MTMAEPAPGTPAAGMPADDDAATAAPQDDTIRSSTTVALDASMADDLSVVNAARVSFARRRTEMSDADAGLIRFLMRDRHGTPFEHNSFRFHIRCPIFVAREWFRHRIGCLTGDTTVTFVDTDGHAIDDLARRMDELWTSWSEPDARRRIQGMDLRVLDESANEFGIGRIEDIVDKGVQPVHRVTLVDGRALTMTENHRVLTDEGWRTMRDAVGLIGDGATARMTRDARFITNGVPAYQDRDIATRASSQQGSVVDKPVPARGWRLTGHPVRVAYVEYVGLRQTFDLCVAGPSHNFVANGMVVHNSFNEFSMRYAKATDDFYVPAALDVRGQVGKPGAYSFEPVDAELAEHTREELRRIYDEAYAAYTALVEQGVARELARSVLPVGAYTEFYWTVNARSLMNFLGLRNAETAQREIRQYAKACETFLEREMPISYAAFIANDRHAP